MKDIKLVEKIEKVLEVVKADASIKWSKRNNPLNERALHLYNTESKKFYLVQNNGNPYLGFYTKKGFVNVIDSSLEEVNITLVQEGVLRNFQSRLDSLHRREQSLNEYCLKVLSI